MVGLAFAGVAADGTEAGAASWAFAQSCNAKSGTVSQNVARIDRKKSFIVFPPLDTLLSEPSGLISRWDSRLEPTAEVQRTSEWWQKHSYWLARGPSTAIS